MSDLTEAIALVNEAQANSKRLLAIMDVLQADLTAANERARVAEAQLQTACEWGAAMWNARDHASHLPDEFREVYVEGSRTVAIVDADSGEWMDVQ